jgi:hypothetical protein
MKTVLLILSLLLTGCAWNTQKFYHTGLRKYAYQIDYCPVYFWNPLSADPFERIGE